jgi:hypothetical protein
MLKPGKHTHPDRTVIHLCLLLLTRLRDRRVEEYAELKAFAKKKVAGGELLFLPALNVLYLLGLVEYRPKTDAFEYRGPNAAV